MVNVSTAAKEILQGVEVAEGDVLRLEVLNTGEIGLVSGKAQLGDQVIEHEGQEVLHISEDVSQALDGSTIDLIETPDGIQLGLVFNDEDLTGDEFQAQ